MIETAFAKINLALHVRRRRDDGYHDIETSFAFAEEGDRLTLTSGGGAGVALTLSGPFAVGLAGEGDNLILRAARAFVARFGAVGDGLAFHLDKRLPVAAGIGGGSADAAAALRLLAKRGGVPADDPDLVAIAAGLGSDVPACLASVPVRGDGRGDRLRPIAAGTLAGLPLLLVNPSVPLATGPVFAGWGGVDRGALADGEPLAGAIAARNDLEVPACAVQPAIATVLAALRGCAGTLLVRMSGSGATCFALFRDAGDCRTAATAIRRDHPGWWCLETRLRG